MEGRLTTMHQIMVADDDAHIRAALKLRLEREAYRVRLARDGAEALEMSLPDPPDLIILELVLPKIDGLQVLRRLKSNRLTRDIPVIILTARPTSAFRDRSYALGATDFLSKPVSLRKLVAQIRALLTKSQTPRDGSRTHLERESLRRSARVA